MSFLKNHPWISGFVLLAVIYLVSTLTWNAFVFFDFELGLKNDWWLIADQSKDLKASEKVVFFTSLSNHLLFTPLQLLISFFTIFLAYKNLTSIQAQIKIQQDKNKEDGYSKELGIARDFFEKKNQEIESINKIRRSDTGTTFLSKKDILTRQDRLIKTILSRLEKEEFNYFENQYGVIAVDLAVKSEFPELHFTCINEAEFAIDYYSSFFSYQLSQSPKSIEVHGKIGLYIIGLIERLCRAENLDPLDADNLKVQEIFRDVYETLTLAGTYYPNDERYMHFLIFDSLRHLYWDKAVRILPFLRFATKQSYYSALNIEYCNFFSKFFESTTSNKLKPINLAPYDTLKVDVDFAKENITLAFNEDTISFKVENLPMLVAKDGKDKLDEAAGIYQAMKDAYTSGRYFNGVLYL